MQFESLIANLDKEVLIELLTKELPSLRAKIGISQDELSRIIGISRQTLSSIEVGKRKMTWNSFMSILCFFSNNDTTMQHIEKLGILSEALKELLNINKRSYNK